MVIRYVRFPLKMIWHINHILVSSCLDLQNVFSSLVPGVKMTLMGNLLDVL